MPLCLFEGVVDLRPNTELLQIKDLKALLQEGVPIDVASHPVRSAVAMFIAEVLGVATREGDADASLWSLIVDSALHIGQGNAAKLANMPLMFLCRLATVLGIAPDLSHWRSGMGLDMADGILRTSRPLHNLWVNPSDTRALRTIAAAAQEYRHPAILRLPKKTRGLFLDGMLDYFTVHNYPMNRLRSLDILKTIFSA